MIGTFRAIRELRGPLAILAAMAFISSLGIAVMLPMMPLYAIALGAAPRDLGLLTSAFTLANMVAQFSSGFLVDRLGTLPLIRGGIATYAGANLLIATAGSVLTLVGFRFVAGLGAGANLVADRVYLSLVAEPARLAFTNGVLASAASTGQLAGPAIGGVIAQFADLRAPFMVVAVTSALAFLAALTLPPPPRSPVHVQSATRTPAITRPLVILVLSNMLLSTGFGMFITTYAPFATSGLGWSTLEVGVLFSVFAAGSILMGPAIGRYADRRGRRNIGAVSPLPIALFGVVMALALPRPVIWVVMFVCGGAIAGFTACWFALLTAASPEARRGRTFGVVNAISLVGVIIGANGAAFLWETIDLTTAVFVSGFAPAIGGLLLLLLPADRAPTEPQALSSGASSPAAPVPAASGSPASR